MVLRLISELGGGKTEERGRKQTLRAFQNFPQPKLIFPDVRVESQSPLKENKCDIYPLLNNLFPYLSVCGQNCPVVFLVLRKREKIEFLLLLLIIYLNFYTWLLIFILTVLMSAILITIHKFRERIISNK